MRQAVLFAVTVLLFYCANGQSFIGKPDVDTSHDSTIRIGKLDNGFSYYIRKNTIPEKKVEIRLIVHAGKLNEDDDQGEIAHLLEHMAFNGTKHYPGTSMGDFFKKSGLTPRAITTDNNTRYSLTLNDPSSGIIDKCLVVVRDWAQDITLDSLEIDMERPVIVAEYTKSEFESARLGFEIISKILDHPKYPMDPTPDIIKSVKSFRHRSLLRFYKDWYRPDLEAIIVVGDIDVKEVERKVKLLFSDLKMPAHPRRNVDENDVTAKYSVKLTSANRFFSFTRDFITNTNIEILLKKQASLIAVKTPDDFYRSLKDQLLNQMISNRMIHLVERYNTPLNSVECYLARNAIHQYARIDAFKVTMSVGDSLAVEAAVKSVLSELSRIKTHGFAESELSKAKGRLLATYAAEEARTSEALTNRYVDLFLGTGIDNEKQLAQKFIGQASLADINDMASFWIDFESNRDVVVKAPVGTEAAIRQATFDSWIKGIKVAGKPGKALPNPEISQLIRDTSDFSKAEPSYIVTEVEELGVYNIILPNQISIVVKPFKPRGVESEKVLIHGFKSGGWSLYDGNRQVTAKYAGSIVNHAGVGDYNKFQLKEYLAPKGVSANVSIEDSLSTLSGYCNRSEVEVLLQYIYLQLTAPRMDADAFEDWKKQWLMEQKANEVDYQRLFGEFLEKNSYRGDLGDDEDDDPDRMEDINLSSAYQIYKERFVDSGGWTFVVTGNFTLEKIGPLLAKYFGKLPFKKRPKRQQLKRDSSQPIASLAVPLKRESKIFCLGSNEKAVVHIFFPNTAKLSFTSRLKLEILGNVLRDRIWERLREKEGAVYSNKASVAFTNGRDDIYAFYIYFQCEVGKADYLIAAAQEEFNKIIKNGVDAESYEKALGRTRGNTLSADLTKNRFWLDYLTLKTITNSDLSEILKRETILTEIITLEEINRAVNLYMVDANGQSFTWLPERFNNK